MKKKILTIIITAALSAIMAIPSFADATRVVTLGNDLSIQQKAQMLKYFGIEDESAVEIIYVNNDQERYYLGAYIPLEQIGDRTFSCSYVKPTTSGGIQVKTANLDYVTCNMIATTLSTCGVTNCQVVAASPIVVSGTGALTGIILAYQQASGETLDETKVELANKEMVVTAGLSEQVGQSNAIAVVNETKYETIENNITNIDEINNVINNISNEYNIEIDDSQKEEIANLVSEIAQQNYEIESLKKTLAEVQANVIEDTNAPETIQQEVIERNDEIIEEEKKVEEESTTAEDIDTNIDIDINIDSDTEVVISEETSIPEETEENILDNTDSSALSDDGTPVQESDTMSTVVEQETTAEAIEPETTTGDTGIADDGDWEVFNFDEETTTDILNDVTEADAEVYPAEESDVIPESMAADDMESIEPANEEASMEKDQIIDEEYLIDGEEKSETKETLYSEEDFANLPEIVDKYEMYTTLKEKLTDYAAEFSEEENGDVIKEMTENILKKFVDYSVKEAKRELAEEETSLEMEEVLIPETDEIPVSETEEDLTTEEEILISEETEDIVIRKEYENMDLINNDILAALEKIVYEELDTNKDVLNSTVTITISEDGEVTDTLQTIYDDVMEIAEEVYSGETNTDEEE